MLFDPESEEKRKISSVVALEGELDQPEVTVSGNVVGFGGRFGSWALGEIKFEDSMPFGMLSSRRSSAGLISCCLSFSVCGVGA